MTLTLKILIFVEYRYNQKDSARVGGPEDGKIESGNVGSVVDGGALGALGVLVASAVDEGVLGSEALGSEAMSALGDTGGGIRELEKMTTVAKERRIEEVGGSVEVRTHRGSSGNNGNCKGIGESFDIDVAVHSNTFIASKVWPEVPSYRASSGPLFSRRS